MLKRLALLIGASVKAEMIYSFYFMALNDIPLCRITAFKTRNNGSSPIFVCGKALSGSIFTNTTNSLRHVYSLPGPIQRKNRVRKLRQKSRFKKSAPEKSRQKIAKNRTRKVAPKKSHEKSRAKIIALEKSRQ
jgi:hypothetical protein